MAFSVIPIWWGLKIPCYVYFRTIHWYLVDIYRGKEIGLMSYWYLPGGLEEMSRSTTFTRASFGIGDRIIYRGCLISYTIRLLRPWGLDGFIWTVYCLMMVWNMNFIVPYIGNVIIQLTNSYFSEELKPPTSYCLMMVDGGLLRGSYNIHCTSLTSCSDWTIFMFSFSLSFSFSFSIVYMYNHVIIYIYMLIYCSLMFICSLYVLWNRWFQPPSETERLSRWSSLANRSRKPGGFMHPSKRNRFGSNRYRYIAGWSFGTFSPYIGKNHPNWRTHIFQRDWDHQPV